MEDLVFVGLASGLFAVSAAYVRALSALVRAPERSTGDAPTEQGS